MKLASAMPPREIAPGIHWLGGCLQTISGGPGVHYHVSTYLVVGDRASLLVDTGDPIHWEQIDAALPDLLRDAPLDYVFPTHPELPHAGNLPRLHERYPDISVVGDVRDFHIHYPELTPNLVTYRAGDRIDLGGRTIEFVPALVRDLPNSLWAVETATGTLFVSDGFAYIHGCPDEIDDETPPPHEPGQCQLTSVELEALDIGPTVEQAAYGTARSLYWTRFVDLTSTFDEIETLVADHSVEIVAPAHGNVITDVARLMPIMLEAHRLTYVG
jgi:flavorubredoxin